MAGAGWRVRDGRCLASAQGKARQGRPAEQQSDAADPALRRAMGAAGRALVERDFAAPLITEQMLALYRDLLRERTDRR